MGGVVHLVGAGPGAADLLTLRAARLIAVADVLVHDRLVSPEILALAPAATPRVDVGKAPGRHPVPQHEINRMLRELARDNACVVRLKGGDPMIFGRGGEEADFLRAHGVRVEVTPGVTAAQGAAASLGLALTDRNRASGLRFVTGHRCAAARDDLDWRGLADPATTLCIYMGHGRSGEFAARLIAHGRDPATPARAVCDATRPTERTMLAPLSDIARRAREARFEGAVLFIVGAAAAQASADVAIWEAADAAAG